MRRLNKTETAKLALLEADMNEAAESLNSATTEYNEKLSDLRDFRDEIVSKMEEYMGERSDKWQESPAGEAYDEWKQSWEDVELDDLDEFDRVENPLGDLEQEVSS